MSEHEMLQLAQRVAVIQVLPITVQGEKPAQEEFVMKHPVIGLVMAVLSCLKSVSRHDINNHYRYYAIALHLSIMKTY